MEFLDLNKIIVNFQKLLNKTIREYIDIRFDLADDLPLIYADRSQLEQILLNLAINAQEAMPEGGTLVIQTQIANLDEKYTDQHTETKPGQYVLLSVSDTGMGMDRTTREKIFEPFFSTKSIDHGSGLGLATVYGIVKQHQGNIWVYSEEEQGTTFKIYIPVLEQMQKKKKKSPVEDIKSTMGNETVLVVEDNDMVREMTVEVLQEQGYNVLFAENGEQCMQLLRKHTGPLHLVLCDIIMPDINGKDLFEQVKNSFPAAKVIYMSGYPENVIGTNNVLEDGFAFIQKPFSVQNLYYKLREVLDSNSL